MSAVPEKAAAAGSEATRCWTRRACEILRKLRAAEDIHKARHDLVDSLIWVALESLFPPGAGAMLQRSSPAVQHCQNRAAECERLAALAVEPQSRDDYLRLAGSWRRLAENREFVGRMERFLGYVKE